MNFFCLAAHHAQIPVLTLHFTMLFSLVNYVSSYRYMHALFVLFEPFSLLDLPTDRCIS